MSSDPHTTIMLFTRDLRVSDNPALAAACRWSERIVPLFVVDDAIIGSPAASPNRGVFLGQALEDLRGRLRELGGDLVIRQGDPVVEVLAVAAETGADRVALAADVTRFARNRLARLEKACGAAGIEVRAFEGVTVVPSDRLKPSGGGEHYRVFTPYWRAWSEVSHRAVEAAPGRIVLPDGLRVGRLPARGDLVRGETSPELVVGGETAGLAVLKASLDRLRGDVELDRDALAADETSHLSAYLHFGCVSASVFADELTRVGAEELLRQLCWRDFHHQVTLAFPDIARRDYRPHGSTWASNASDAISAWKQGRTGIPIVDAGMRQLLREGWMHNRARMITASFLTKRLQVDWRVGAEHFFTWLVDGDIANNGGNWQWVAGTGNDTRPNRVLSPLRQAQRFDADGEYVRKYVPELGSLPGGAVHEPWKLPEAVRKGLDYPAPLIEL